MEDLKVIDFIREKEKNFDKTSKYFPLYGSI